MNHRSPEAKLSGSLETAALLPTRPAVSGAELVRAAEAGADGASRRINGTLASMKSLMASVIGDELARVDQLIVDAVQSRHEVVQRIGRRAAAMGGKRLRPALLLLSAKACATAEIGPREQADLLSTAAAIELVHTASLVHDDVMDQAEQRRHQATVAHADGNSAAVLLGDFLFTRGYALAATCRSTLPARQIAAAATKLCEGELRQQASAANWHLSLAEYRSILRQKTASLCATSCRLGAWRVQAPTAERQAVGRFGTALGLAFQIYDDWLDYWGGEEVGKTLGTDLAQLKPTLPLIRLLATSPAKRRAHLIACLSSRDPQALPEIRAALEQSDAAAFTLQAARRYVDAAKRQLVGLPDSPATYCLTALAEFSVRRDR